MVFQLARQLRDQEHNLALEGRVRFDSCIIQRKDALDLQEHVEQRNAQHPIRQLAFDRCKFDIREDGTMEALQRFFTSLSSSLESLDITTPTLSNEHVAEMLHGSRLNIRELSFRWTFARAATLNRHLVFQPLVHLRKLELAFLGMEMFAEMDGDFAQTLPQMVHLEELCLWGWTVRDVRLRELITALQPMPALTSLHLKDIKGLTSCSLTEFRRLQSLRTLQISRCQTLFSNATDEQMNTFLQTTMSADTLALRNCGLTRPQVRRFLGHVGVPAVCRLSSFVLVDTAFGVQECELLCDVLPKTRLTSLQVQARHGVSEDELGQQLMTALGRNTTLESFDVQCEFRFGRRNASRDGVERILRRNRRAHLVDRILREIPIDTPSVSQRLVLALAKVLTDPESASDVQRLLLNRVVWLVPAPTLQA